MMRFIGFVGLALTLALTLALPARADVNIQEVTSPGGITAWLVEEHSLPFVALELNFQGGASMDLPGKRGASNLMTALLDEGAGDLDARSFLRQKEALAMSLGFDIDDDFLSVQTRFLTETRDEAQALLRSALQQPRFDEEAIERIRAAVLSNIASNLKDPNSIAGLAFDGAAYGDHPYGTSLSGSLEGVAELTRDDLVAAHGNLLVRDRVYVGVVGDITPEELGVMLDDLLGDLPESSLPLPPKTTLDLPQGGETVIDFATPQSVAIFGQKGLGVDDPDYFAAILLNQVLGGGSFESRLMTEVREKRGLTYGVSSYLAPRPLANMYMGSVSSANDRIAEAISVIREEWAKAAATGVTAAELEAAKTYLTGAYPLRFDGNSRIASILVGMQSIGLTPEYIVGRNDKVNAVTLEDVNRVAAELLDPEALHFVVVGQPEGLGDKAAE
ncbi:MAG: M16 family metallopeptidase [Sulfitobacter sp.]